MYIRVVCVKLLSLLQAVLSVLIALHTETVQTFIVSSIFIAFIEFSVFADRHVTAKRVVITEAGLHVKNKQAGLALFFLSLVF